MLNLSTETLGKIVDWIKKETGAKGVALFVSMDTLPCEEKIKNGKCSDKHLLESCIEGIDLLNLLGIVRVATEDVQANGRPPRSSGSIPSPFQ